MFQIKQQPYRDFHLDDGIIKGVILIVVMDKKIETTGRIQIRKKDLCGIVKNLDIYAKA